jgi:hypothetical protein
MEIDKSTLNGRLRGLCLHKTSKYFVKLTELMNWRFSPKRNALAVTKEDNFIYAVNYSQSCHLS